VLNTVKHWLTTEGIKLAEKTAAEATDESWMYGKDDDGNTLDAAGYYRQHVRRNIEALADRAAQEAQRETH
jgi:hypothetical protein